MRARARFHACPLSLFGRDRTRAYAEPHAGRNCRAEIRKLDGRAANAGELELFRRERRHHRKLWHERGRATFFDRVHDELPQGDAHPPRNKRRTSERIFHHERDCEPHFACQASKGSRRHQSSARPARPPSRRHGADQRTIRCGNSGFADTLPARMGRSDARYRGLPLSRFSWPPIALRDTPAPPTKKARRMLRATNDNSDVGKLFCKPCFGSRKDSNCTQDQRRTRSSPR